MAEIIEVANVAYEARDRAQAEISSLKVSAEKEKAEFEHDWKVKDPKNSKAKLQVFEKYDATAMMKNSVRVPEADATVKKTAANDL